MSSSKITHPAVVQSVGGGKIAFLIQAQDACGSCAAKKICGSGDTKTITLDDDGLNRQPGDHATLVISKSMGFTAIAIAYILPILLIIGLLLLFKQFQITEMTAGIATLCFVCGYFLLLSAFKNKLKNQITITIE